MHLRNSLLFGLIFCTPCWAGASPKKHSQKPTVNSSRLASYSDSQGRYQMNYPETWQISAKEGAVLVRSSRGPDGGVFGIMCRPDDRPNSQAIKKELKAKDRPADLTQAPARVGGLPATKLIGSKKNDPATKMVEYYIQNPATGHQFYVLLMAPKDQWSRYSPTFGSILNSLSLQ